MGFILGIEQCTNRKYGLFHYLAHKLLSQKTIFLGILCGSNRRIKEKVPGTSKRVTCKCIVHLNIAILKRTEPQANNRLQSALSLNNPREIRPAPVPIGNLLKCKTGPKRNIFLKRLGINHKADGKSLFCISARHAQATHV